jgi:dienelactone hydrolase
VSTQITSFSSEQWLLNACVHVPDDEPQQKIGVVLVAEVTKFGRHGLFRHVAEAFAESGFYALRFDNRGTHDSPGDCEVTFDQRIADACAAAHFLKTEYKLDKVLFWGFCLGGALAVHASARLSGQFKPAGMMLCSLVVDPLDATLPEFNYRPMTVYTFLRNGLTGSPWNRLRQFMSDSGYRKNMLRSATSLARTYLRGNGELQSMRMHFSRIGPLLAEYDGPTLLVYGDVDPYWPNFTKRINAGDKLGLSKMKSPPKIAVVPNGDHAFRSVQQRSAVIQLCVSWATALRDGQTLASQPEEIHAIFASSAAD